MRRRGGGWEAGRLEDRGCRGRKEERVGEGGPHEFIVLWGGQCWIASCERPARIIVVIQVESFTRVQIHGGIEACEWPP